VVEKISTRVVILDRGKIVAEGSVHELAQTSHSSSLEQIFRELTNQREDEDKIKLFAQAVLL
jgi:ABC-2 type transport system ATP-binding protein